MGKIPVLDNAQMHRLREVVGGRKRYDLTTAPKTSTRRLPEEEVSAGGNCKIAVMTVNPSGGFGAAGGKDIRPASDGTYTVVTGGQLLGITTLFL